MTCSSKPSRLRDGSPCRAASAGSVAAQPALGRAADVWGYPAAYVISAGIQLVAVPFLVLARRTKAPSDPVGNTVSP